MKRRTIFRCVPRGRGPCGGFTLIELLVVISIVALLTAILLPRHAGRVRRQARAVACRAKLRQWGLVFSAYLTENNNDRGFGPGRLSTQQEPGIAWFRPYCSNSNDLLFCPMATRHELNPNDPYFGVRSRGEQFRRWRPVHGRGGLRFHSKEGGPSGRSFYGSYGMEI